VTAELLSIDEALERVLAAVRPLPAEEVETAAAAGRVLAEAAAAVVDLPPFDSSAMDGFALRSSDTPGELPIVGRVAAGRPAGRPLEPGEAMGIATGGVIPEGADAVVPIEIVREEGDRLTVPDPVAAGASVRPRGGDVRAGDAVVPAGTLLHPHHLAALLAGGIGRVRVGARPRVGILATGTELRPAGTPLEPGQVYDANGPMLAAQAARTGAEPTLLTAVEDDEAAHREALERGLGHDVLVTSGGVSVGPHDLVRSVGSDLGVEEVFWGIAMRPGKPLWFGTRGGTLVFGLPGNPVSSFVCFELFVRPALRALQGDAAPAPPFAPGTLAGPVRRNGARDDLVRARQVAGGLEPITGQESHMITRAATADALVLVPRGEGELAAGDTVQFLRI
jgi:molybdopterin molybdotransferase